VVQPIAPTFKDVAMTADTSPSLVAFLPRVALGFGLWMFAGPLAGETSDPLPEGPLPD
jgi:hypothetical protein